MGAPATRVEQPRAWESSCVYRLRSRRGVFYLKAVAARCDWEPRLTRWLAHRFPRLIAPVVAVGGGGRWLLSREVKGSILRRSRQLPGGSTRPSSTGGCSAPSWGTRRRYSGSAARTAGPAGLCAR